jgi:hypothetical protein
MSSVCWEERSMNRDANGTGSEGGGCRTCEHRPQCPSAGAPDHEAARVVAAHPEQGWSLLCNGVIVFDDLGELLPDGRVLAPPPVVLAA